MSEQQEPTVRTLSYSLTRADALAYMLLRHELTGWEKFRLLVCVASGGLLVGLLPADMSRSGWWAAAVAIMALFSVLAVVWSNVEVRRRAAKLPLPSGEVALERLDDGLHERSNAGVRHVAYAGIAQVIATEAHVFVRAEPQPVIVPRSAFESTAEMRAFADAVDVASNAAQP